jgi:hypothetical protein
MATGWTLERRAKQAAAIRRWRPWEHSTGPKTPQGKAKSARNGCARSTARHIYYGPYSEAQSVRALGRLILDRLSWATQGNNQGKGSTAADTRRFSLANGAGSIPTPSKILGA